MHEKYQPLPVGCDLSLVSLEAALDMTPKFTLYVHADLVDIARRIIAEPEVAGEQLTVVVDPELGAHAWYVTAAVGSQGA
jgi:hypothetical protein